MNTYLVILLSSLIIIFWELVRYVSAEVIDLSSVLHVYLRPQNELWLTFGVILVRCWVTFVISEEFALDRIWSSISTTSHATDIAHYSLQILLLLGLIDFSWMINMCTDLDRAGPLPFYNTAIFTCPIVIPGRLATKFATYDSFGDLVSATIRCHELVISDPTLDKLWVSYRGHSISDSTFASDFVLAGRWGISWSINVRLYTRQLETPVAVSNCS